MGFWRLVFLSSVVFISGCAEDILSNQERKYIKGAKTSGVVNTADLRLSAAPLDSGNKLEAASALARNLSNAYLEAGQNAARVQNLAAAGTFLAAAQVISAEQAGKSGVSLADKATIGVGIQQVAQRGVRKDAIDGIYYGARSMNCISTIATIYSATELGVNQGAYDVTLSVVQEARITARAKMVNEAVEFSTILGSLRSARSTENKSIERLGENDLEGYLTRLTGCLEKPKLSDNDKG